MQKDSSTFCGWKKVSDGSQRQNCDSETLRQCFPNFWSLRTIKERKNFWRTTKSLKIILRTIKLKFCLEFLTVFIINWLKTLYFWKKKFLADQITHSCGPKKVRGPDFGKHCLKESHYTGMLRYCILMQTIIKFYSLTGIAFCNWVAIKPILVLK